MLPNLLEKVNYDIREENDAIKKKLDYFKNFDMSEKKSKPYKYFYYNVAIDNHFKLAKKSKISLQHKANCFNVTSYINNCKMRKNHFN